MLALASTSIEFALPLIVLAALLEFWRLRHAGPNLVIREFRLSSPESTGEFLYILGRRGGLFAWLLAPFGLHPQTSFSVTHDEVTRETVGPHGFEHQYAPLAEIDSTHCSYYRAFSALLLSIVFYSLGLFKFLSALSKSNDYAQQSALADASGTLWVSLLGGTACYLWYALSKRVFLSLTATGGTTIGISFKRSVLDNLVVELKQTMDAVDRINLRILQIHSTPTGGN